MKTFIINSKNIDRDAAVWNMIGGMLNAFQSVILLMVLTRTVGLVASGIFTIAYANANLFLNIGKYGMRNYQVSDVKGEFTFREYLTSRWITTAIMIIVSLVYVIYMSLFNEYSFEKSQIVIWMCLLKVPDSVEDIYFGDYQKKGRLDVASKAMALRMIVTILMFAVIVVVTKNLLVSLIATTCATLILAIVFIRWTYPMFREEENKRIKKTGILLWNCFPVFAGAFLSFYIGNAPKYAIDAQLTDEMQACYGFIAMPVFVIGLLNSFILNPMLFKMSCLWNDGKVKEFVTKTLFLAASVFFITVICIAGAYVLGIPVLSFLYNTDLSSYKAELMVLLVGGGFLGLSGVLNAVLTIMRYQKNLLIGYATVAVLAFFMANPIVQNYEIMGAAILYTVLMAVLCVLFILFAAFGIWKKITINLRNIDKNAT